MMILTASGLYADGSSGGYRYADLPPLLEYGNGTPVRTAHEWFFRAAEIRDLMCKYFIGTFPKVTPPIVESQVISEKQVDGQTRRMVRVTLGTPNRLSFDIELWIPQGSGPFPVLLLQPNSDQLEWARMAADRGYLVCLYPGLDGKNREDGYPGFESASTAFRAEYPDATWTEIPAKAWLASRTLDYLLDPANAYPIARQQVGIIGHSRYGKQALIAAAFDRRITAVVAVSPGSPASSAYRFTSRDTFMEAPADFEGEWFLKDLKSYAGRENELPIDAHAWMALIAPRRCMIDTAYNDQCEPTFAVERSYLAAQKVYQLLGQEGNLRLSYRPGGHYPLTQEHRAQDLDWFDTSFGRSMHQYPETLIHHFDWEQWRSRQSDLSIPSASADKRARIAWSLGKPPSKLPIWTGRGRFETDEQSKLLLRDRKAAADIVRVPVCFGDGVSGNVYFDPKIKGPMPAVIWLHPYNYSMGYSEVYGVPGTTIYHRLAKEGFIVLAYDQLGFGSRILEGPEFRREHPEWSPLGRMVADVSAAVDFLRDGKGKSKSPIPAIRSDAIFALGYSLGGMVGLYATALDDRIAGVASFCGFTPLRTDTDAKPTGGIRRLWEWHALQPRLGLFQGKESEIPFDYNDILSLIAPRPCLIVAPQHDRMADPAGVTTCVQSVRWDRLTYLTSDDYNRFQGAQQNMFLDWIRQAVPAAR